MTGEIERFLGEDHTRLDGLLDRAIANADAVDRESYDRFRCGLLRHIRMEEKLLLPRATEAGGGRVLPIAARLRLDHGAIAALLVPSPFPALIEIVRTILARHNELEEGPRGLYADCDRLLDQRSVDLVQTLKDAPKVRASPCHDGPLVMAAAGRALRRAGYDLEAEKLLAGESDRSSEDPKRTRER